jgi:NitT/TauT family transport system substrate-binding protein
MSIETGQKTPLVFGSKAAFLPFLTKELGYFDREGLDVTVLNKPELKAYEAENGPVDAQANWFQHAVYGASNEKPLVGVLVLHDAPGVTIMVADRVKDEIHSAADFAGRNVAEGASRSAKGILTNYLATREGLPEGSYTPVMSALDGRREAVTQGLHDGTVDVLTFMEPMTSYMKETGLVSTLYDLGDKAATVKTLGCDFPAETVLVTPGLLNDGPEVVQALVNAFLATLEFVKTSAPEDVAAKLPETWLAGKDQSGRLNVIRNRWVTIAQDDYRLNDDEATLMIKAIQAAPFDDTESGRTRARAKTAAIRPTDLYTNEFLDKALASAT